MKPRSLSPPRIVTMTTLPLALLYDLWGISLTMDILMVLILAAREVRSPIERKHGRLEFSLMVYVIVGWLLP